MATRTQGDVEQRSGRPGGDAARERLLAGLPVTERHAGGWPASRPSRSRAATARRCVLLHGPAGSAAHWMRVIPDLVTTHRVVAPDLPGHGASGIAGRAARRRPHDRLARRADRADLPHVRRCWSATRSAAPSPPASRPSTRTGSSRLVLVDSLGLAGFDPSPEFGGPRTSSSGGPTERTQTPCGSTARSIWTGCARGWAIAWEPFRAYNVDRARHTERHRRARRPDGAVRAGGDPAGGPRADRRADHPDLGAARPARRACPSRRPRASATAGRCT